LGERAAKSLAPLFACWLLSGCVALTNPLANGVPVRLLPPEVLGEPQADKKPITLSLLRQKPPDVYRLAPGDTLSIWIEGVLGERGQVPPVQTTDQPELAPAIGFPIPVRADGTITLPYINPVRVEGLSIEEAQTALQKAYVVDVRILNPKKDRIFVSLLRRRHYRILVVREDSLTTPAGAVPATGTKTPTFTFGPTSTGIGTHHGYGIALDLPAYENDVLNALTLSGGLPGLDAVNEVRIERDSKTGNLAQDRQVLRIPLRARPGELPTIRPEDVVLQTGDIVFIEARTGEFFYTDGILPPGEHVVPRDYDLHVVDAVARVGGPLVGSGINPNNISGTVVNGGFGFPSPSLLTVVRHMPGGGQIPIRVDLNRALRDPHENILVEPGDLLILQEKPGEAVARYVTQTVLRFSFVWQLIHGPHEAGSTSVTVP
jgi:protein involved in polysaccharide export with SLBB domain